MASNRVWNLIYYAGNTGRVVNDSDNPRVRSVAIAGATRISKTGWRVWVEHAATGKRIWESDAEKKAKG